MGKAAMRALDIDFGMFFSHTVSLNEKIAGLFYSRSTFELLGPGHYVA